MLLVGVAVLTFSSLVYFAEKDNPKVNTLFVDNIELAYIIPTSLYTQLGHNI